MRWAQKFGGVNLAITDRVGRTVLNITGSSVAGLLAVAGSVLVMLIALRLAAPDAAAWPAALLIVVALLALTMPDGGAGLVLLFGYGIWWLSVVPASSVGWAALASVAGLVLHLALAHAAAGPAGAGTDAATARALFTQTLTIALGTVALAVVVLAAQDAFRTPVVLVGLALGLLALIPWLAKADFRAAPDPED